MGCANVYAFAGIPANDKLRVVAERRPNIAIVNPQRHAVGARPMPPIRR
jgi:phosphogluconate dehydratase